MEPNAENTNFAHWLQFEITFQLTMKKTSWLNDRISGLIIFPEEITVMKNEFDTSVRENPFAFVYFIITFQCPKTFYKRRQLSRRRILAVFHRRKKDTNLCLAITSAQFDTPKKLLSALRNHS